MYTIELRIVVGKEPSTALTARVNAIGTALEGVASQLYANNLDLNLSYRVRGSVRRPGKSARSWLIVDK